MCIFENTKKKGSSGRGNPGMIIVQWLAFDNSSYLGSDTTDTLYPQ
jgi:hypothetical protein